MINPRSLHALALAVGLLGGVLVGCGTKPASCTNCAGCCDSKGTCQTGTANDVCGSAGNVCSACQVSTSCKLGLCVANSNGTGGGTGGGTTGGGTGGGTTGGGTGGGTTGGGTGGGTTGGGTGGGTQPMQATITELANGTLTDGTCVELHGVVMSAVFADGDDTFTTDAGTRMARSAFYLSEKNLTTTAPFTGVEVVVDIGQVAPTTSPGDDVTVAGIVRTNFGHPTLRLIASCAQFTKVGTTTMPAPAVVTIASIGQSGGSSGCPVTGAAWVDGTDARGYDGTLARFTAGSVSAPRDTFGQFEVADGTGSKLQVANTLGTTVAPTVGQVVTSITGFGQFSFCRRKLRPRDNAEVVLAAVVTTCGSGGRADHLVISEISVTPTPGEFVEIFNPTASSLDLTDVYLYNATFAATDGGPGCKYAFQPTGGACGDAFGDFNLRFPAGATIAPSEVQVVALTGANAYCATYGCSTGAAKPTYEISPPTGDDATVPNMRGVWDLNAANFPDGGVQGGFGFLTNGSEDLVLYSWNGSASTVKDIDYVVWGTSLGVRTDKTTYAGYSADTAASSQVPAPGAPTVTQSIQRVCLNEGTETHTAGNGITGHNETSENLANDFLLLDKTPMVLAPNAAP